MGTIVISRIFSKQVKSLIQIIAYLSISTLPPLHPLEAPNIPFCCIFLSLNENKFGLWNLVIPGAHGKVQNLHIELL